MATDEIRALVDEIESQRETIRDLLAALDDMIAELHTLRARVAEMERDLDACRAELLEARHAVGEGWFAGGVTLAEAIERKCRMLEGDNEISCENTPWPGCDCPGCETERERAEAKMKGGDR